MKLKNIAYETSLKDVKKELQLLHHKASHLKTALNSEFEKEAIVASEMVSIVNWQLINELDAKCRELIHDLRANMRNICGAKKKFFGGIDYDPDEWISKEIFKTITIHIPPEYEIAGLTGPIGYKIFSDPIYSKYMVSNNLGGKSSLGVTDYKVVFKTGGEDEQKIISDQFFTTAKMRKIVEALSEVESVINTVDSTIKSLPSCKVNKVFISKDDSEFHASLKSTLASIQDTIDNL